MTMGCYDPCSWGGANSYPGYGCFGTYAFDCVSPNGCGPGAWGYPGCGPYPSRGYGLDGCGYRPGAGSACGPRLWNCGRWP